MAEKTEEATPKKLRDARKKGQVAKAQDLPGAFTFITSIWVVLALSSYIYHYLADFLVSAFSLINQPNKPQLIISMFYRAIEVIFLASIPILGVVACIGVLVTFLAVGPVFSTEVFKFDIKKFNPITNLKQKFKLKTLVELLKSILKITLASYIIYTVVFKSIPVLVQTVSVPMIGALLIFYSFLSEVVAKVGLLFLVIAVADFIYQKKSFATEMKMEKFEVKQEYKNTEGNPEIKGKRRQLAQEIAYQEGPAGSIKRARALVTNPTHLAIALGYDKRVDIAPYVLAMGSDHLADQMIKMAEKYNIPIIRNVPIAHKLWEEGGVYEYVPEDTYEALAEIIRWVDSLKDENNSENIA
jgi:type III secretion protein U